MPRRARKPPPALVSGQVLEYAVLPKSVPYSGAGLHFVDGKDLGWVPCLAIERGFGSGHVLLLYCDRECGVVSFAEFPSVGKAKARAERMYRGASSHWRNRRVTEAQAKDYLAHRWDGYECSFCRRSPAEASPMFANGLARICGPCVEEYHASLAEEPAEI
jgi:hypothetical protein